MRLSHSDACAFRCIDFSWRDLTSLEWIIDQPKDGQPEQTDAQKTAAKEAARHVARFAANREDCRRVLLLNEFKEEYSGRCGDACDNCLEYENSEHRDFTAEAMQLLRYAKSVCDSGVRVTENVIVQGFRGSNNKAVRDKGLDAFALFGSGRNMELGIVERLANYLSREDALQIYEHANEGNQFSSSYTRVRL